MLDRSEFLLRIQVEGEQIPKPRSDSTHMCKYLCTHTYAIKFLKKTLQMVICSVYELYRTLASKHSGLSCALSKLFSQMIIWEALTLLSMLNKYQCVLYYPSKSHLCFCQCFYHRQLSGTRKPWTLWQLLSLYPKLCFIQKFQSYH